MRCSERVAAGTIVLLLIIMPLASADIPHLISLQGRLTDATDNPITSSTNFAFRIYDAPTGGSALWTEFQTLAPDALGTFSALLGSVAALNIPFNISYWLEVQVNSEVLSPRTRMGSAGYALRSESPWNTTGNNIYTTNAGNVGIGTNNPLGKLHVSGGDAIFGGNVGIGTTTPGAKLDVQGGDIKVGSAVTIKGDGSISTGLNAQKVGGYNATELMASAKVQGCNDCDNDKHVSYSYCFNNDCSLRGDDCDDTNPAIIGGAVPYYCDKDGDGVISSSSPSGTTCGSPPAGCTTTPGTDCNDNDADIYPGHAGKSTTDGKDNNCNGQVDECVSSSPSTCISWGKDHHGANDIPPTDCSSRPPCLNGCRNDRDYGAGETCKNTYQSNTCWTVQFMSDCCMSYSASTCYAWA